MLAAWLVFHKLRNTIDWLRTDLVRQPSLPLTAAWLRTYSARVHSDDEGESGETPELARNCMPKAFRGYRRARIPSAPPIFVERFVVQA